MKLRLEDLKKVVGGVDAITPSPTPVPDPGAFYPPGFAHRDAHRPFIIRV